MGKKRLVALVALMVIFVVLCTMAMAGEGAPGKRILVYRVIKVEKIGDRCQTTEFLERIERYTIEPQFYYSYVEPDQSRATVREVKVWYSPDGTPLKWEYEDDVKAIYEIGELIEVEVEYE